GRAPQPRIGKPPRPAGLPGKALPHDTHLGFLTSLSPRAGFVPGQPCSEKICHCKLFNKKSRRLTGCTPATCHDREGRKTRKVKRMQGSRPSNQYCRRNQWRTISLTALPFLSL